MTPLQAIATIVFNLLRRSSNKLTLKTVQIWLEEHGNCETSGAGYSGSRLSRGPRNGFAEIVKKPVANGKFEVTAAVYFDQKQGTAASKTWPASKLDAALDQYFGKNSRVRINI